MYTIFVYLYVLIYLFIICRVITKVQNNCSRKAFRIFWLRSKKQIAICNMLYLRAALCHCGALVGLRPVLAKRARACSPTGRSAGWVAASHLLHHQLRLFGNLLFVSEPDYT